MANFCSVESSIFVTKIDYVHYLTGEVIWTQRIPNTDQNVSAAIVVDPKEKKAFVKVDDLRVSSTVFKEAVSLADKGNSLSEVLTKSQISFKAHSSPFREIKEGQGTVRRSRVTVSHKDSVLFEMRKQTSTMPNVKSGITRNVLGRGQIASAIDYNSTYAVGALQTMASSKLLRGIAKPISLTDRGLKATEIGADFYYGNNEDAMKKSGRLAGGLVSDFTSGTLAVAGTGMLITAGVITAPLAIPVFLVLVAVGSLATEKMFEYEGELLFGKLYQWSNQIIEREKGRSIESTELSEDFRKAAANPFKNKMEQETVIATMKRKDGTVETVKLSDLSLGLD